MGFKITHAKTRSAQRILFLYVSPLAAFAPLRAKLYKKPPQSTPLFFILK